MLILVRNRQRKIGRFFSSFSSHFPAAVHFEMIQLCAALLDTHRFAKSHPVFRISARDTQRFVRTNACDSANILNVPLRVVLIWRCPSIDNCPDGIKAVRMMSGTGTCHLQFSLLKALKNHAKTAFFDEETCVFSKNG